MQSGSQKHNDRHAEAIASAEAAAATIKKKLAVALKERGDAPLEQREITAARVAQLQNDLSDAIRQIQELKRAETLQREIDHKQKREQKLARVRQQKLRRPGSPTGQPARPRLDWETLEAYEKHLESSEREREEEAERTRQAFDQAVAAEERENAAALERETQRLAAEAEARAQAEAQRREAERAAQARDRQAASLRRKEEAKDQAQRRRRQREQQPPQVHAPAGVVARIRDAMTTAWHWLRKRE